MNNCPIHNVPFKEYTSKTTGKPYMGHWDAAANGMCFPPKGTALKPETPVKTANDIVREPLPQRDFEAENRGKVRHGIVVAMIEHDGLKQIDPNMKMVIDELVEYIMTGV